MTNVITSQRFVLYQWGVLMGASLVAALFDWRTRRIPNAVTIPLLVVGLVQATWRGGLLGLGEAAAACVLLALPYVVLFLSSQGGAGDAKLMGAIGAWLGLKQGVIVLLCVALAGIVLAIATAMAQRRLKAVLSNMLVHVYSIIIIPTTWLRCLGSMQDASVETTANQVRRLKVPYGVAIFAGVCSAGAIVLIW